ncbi:uncharacterized protein LOC113789905 [Dermatophagoides pteronyssinus]|uniref:uncharacterized protein LOC113789905 n=1 Tax=Dermatophagoides pteronyssinus TaxID=6956 RepID=UPI003F6680E5
MLLSRTLINYCQIRLQTIFINKQPTYKRFIISSSHYFSTKIDTENGTTKSVWKSSSNLKSSADRPKLDRKELLKSLDVDLSYVKNEITLFEIANPSTYRVYFIVIIANFLFWIVCANILYKFYSFIGKRKAVIEREKQYEQNKHEMKYLDRMIEYFSVYGYQKFTKWLFLTIGIGSTALFFFLLSRCVSFIRLMPGGKQIKVGLINWYGGCNPEQRAKIFNLADVTTREHRTERCYYISMKVKNRKSTLLIERDGHFPNETLYDLTLGVQRTFNQ